MEIGHGEDKQFVAFSMAEIVKLIDDKTNGWPRRVDNALFVDDRGVCWLERPPALFGWLGRHHGVIHWHRARGCVNKEELFAELQRTAKQYAAIEHSPHEPLIGGHYYACKTPEVSDGDHLAELLVVLLPRKRR